MLVKFVDNYSLQVAVWIGIFIIAIIVEVFTKKSFGFVFGGCAIISMALAIFNVKFGHQLLTFGLLSLTFMILAKWKFIKGIFIRSRDYIQHSIESTPETEKQEAPKV